MSLKVEVDGKIKEVEVTMISSPSSTEASVGLELLSPQVAFVDFKNKTTSSSMRRG
jgi:hypothetical protein